MKRWFRRQAGRAVEDRLRPVDTSDTARIREGTARFLGVRPDEEYSRIRSAQREGIIAQLSGCSPADSSPADLAAYVGEAALRFYRTLDALQASLDQLDVRRPRLLEIGSNPYFLTLLLADRFPHLEHLGVNYFGAERPAMEEQAIIDDRRRLAKSRFLHADIERDDLEPGGAFDLALFCEVLEHLPFDPAWALYNVARRLKPGGHLILSTPNPARFENIVRLIATRETFSDPISKYGIHGRHNREYSAAELREMLERTGLRVVQVETIDVLPDAYSRDLEVKGYGAYHLIRSVLEGEATLYRPAWLYRGFSPDHLASSTSFVARRHS